MAPPRACTSTVRRLRPAQSLPPYQPQTANPLVIGQSEPGDNWYFPGRLEEAAVYGSALSATQVQHHYSVATTGH